MNRIDNIKRDAPEILALIKDSHNILLHCHPHADPDSIGSALAFKRVLEQMSKNATLLSGDSALPIEFFNLPGADNIVIKSVGDEDFSKYDTFIILDSASIGQICRKADFSIPENLKTIAIDHHESNTFFAKHNFIYKDSIATSEILFYLFKEWGTDMDSEISANLFCGIWTDSGGLMYALVDEFTYLAGAELIKKNPEVKKILSTIMNNNTKSDIRLLDLSLSSAKEYDNGLVISLISMDKIKEQNIDAKDISAHLAIPLMRSVIGWDVVALGFETAPNIFKVSFRTRDENKYDLSKLAVMLGGGGHRAASGAVINASISEVEEKILSNFSKIFI